mgnify:CR=1 FL=1
MDMKLIKMINDHYWLKHDSVVNKIEFKGRTFYNKYERIDKTLTQAIIDQHLKGQITVAHSLINKFDKVENIVVGGDFMPLMIFQIIEYKSALI